MQICLMHEDSIGLAITVGQRAAQISPNNASVWHNIGKCYHDMQMDKEADEYFRKAIKVQPNFPPSLEGLGMSCLNRGEFEDAIGYCNRALAENHDATEARINRAM